MKSKVRRKVSDTVKRLLHDIPGIRISVIAHGDYCDSSSTYVTKIMDFSSDEKKLCDFVNNVTATGESQGMWLVDTTLTVYFAMERYGYVEWRRVLYKLLKTILCTVCLHTFTVSVFPFI